VRLALSAALPASLGPGRRCRPGHPGGGAQLQRLDEEAGQGLLVAGAEAGDGHVVGGLVGGKDPEGDVLGAAAFDLPGGAHAQAVAVEEHAQQGLGVVGGVAVPVGPVGTKEGLEVDLVGDVEDDQARWPSGSQSRRSGGSRKGWSRSPRKKLYGIAHSTCLRLSCQIY
jgi:hypothetical protein